MSEAAKPLLTVDEFLETAEAREGRWELEDGVAYAMSPERIVHAETKLEVVLALRAAIERAKLPCRAVIDGPAVRITPRTAYQPDASVYCGPRLPDTALEIPAPIILVEVLSPSTRTRDQRTKPSAYFSLPSLRHYLILHAEKRAVFHHRRDDSNRVETRLLHAGPLRLDPPGLDLSVEALFPAT